MVGAVVYSRRSESTKDCNGLTWGGGRNEQDAGICHSRGYF